MAMFPKQCMRAMFASLLALPLGFGVAGPLSAETQAKKEKPQAKHTRPSAENGRVRTPRPDPYVELNADKMPIGTPAWWAQMQREGRLGGETP